MKYIEDVEARIQNTRKLQYFSSELSPLVISAIDNPNIDSIFKQPMVHLNPKFDEYKNKKRPTYIADFKIAK